MDRIENIVFDMGNVLVNYDPLRVCRHYMQDGEEIRRVHTAGFCSPGLWLMLDMGLISEEEALGKMQSRLDTEHEKEMRRCAWPIGTNSAWSRRMAWRRWCGN